MLVLNKSLCRLALIAAVLAGALISGVGTAGGDLVFLDERTLELTWEQTEAGVDVVVCNMGNVSAFQVTLTGFNFRVDGNVVSDEMVLRTPTSNFTLDGGNCTKVHIQTTAGVIPDPGEYTGLLVLADVSADEIVRREVTIERRPVESAVDEIVLTATRDWSFLSNASLDTSYLPLKPPGSNKPLNLTEGTHIGIVYSEGHIGHVYVNGTQDNTSQDGVVLLPIRIDSLDAVGTYSGKLYLAGTGNDKGAIQVKVKVTDHIIWALLIIVIAVTISFFLQLRDKRKKLMDKLMLLLKKLMLLLNKLMFKKPSADTRILDEQLKTLKILEEKDMSVIILSAVVAILGGLTRFYFGKTFGTYGDYIALFALGAGTEVALNGTRLAYANLISSKRR